MGIFTLSIWVRKDHLGQTFNTRHDWLSAHTLVTMKVWDKEGIANHHFSSVLTFCNKGDKFDYCLCSLVDAKGNAYYVSYGPFALILPYTLFKFFGVPFNELSIAWFGLIIHFLTAYFVFLIIASFSFDKNKAFYLAPYIGFVLYVFSPGTLWFHANVYFSEILTQLLIVVLLYVYILIIKSASHSSKRLVWLYAILCFVGVYTEWLNLFFAFLTGLSFFWMAFWSRQYWPYFWAALSSSILAIVLILVQYSSIAGWEAFITSALGKFNERNTSDFTSVLGNGKTAIGQVLDFIVTDFSNIFLLLGSAMLLLVAVLVIQRKIVFLKWQLLAIGCLIGSVLMHHILFFHFTHDHDFSILKTGLALILAIGLLFSTFENVLAGRKKLYWLYIALFTGITLFETVGAVKKYQLDYTKKPDHEMFKKIGWVIQKTALPSEKVFSNAFSCPQLMYYANRNVLNDFEDGGKAEFHNRTTKEPTVFFKVNGDKCVYYTRRNASGDSVHVDLLRP